MKTNEELQEDVQNAIKWEPLIHAAEIGVIAEDGMVTLTGFVDNYSKKTEAENAAKKVAGVKVLVEKIEVKFHTNWAKKDDNDIGKEVVEAFNMNWQIPNDKIKVKVENGWLTLEGTVIWNYQKEAAFNAVKNLTGVIGVSNNIIIQSDSDDNVEKKAIEEALNRNWSLRQREIKVCVIDDKVTLTGMVDSWYQKDEANRIAWNAPGVKGVNNDLEIEYNYDYEYDMDS
jgi:osmotically-inducible protein OsmY